MIHIKQKLIFLSCNRFSSAQFSLSVLPDSLWPHVLQHARPPCPWPTPGVYSESIESVMLSSHLIFCCHFSSCLKSFPASGSFQMCQLFPSGAQSIGVWASASVLPMNTQDWSPLGWTGLISLKSKGFSRVFSNTASKASVLQHSTFFIVQISHPYMTTGKTITLIRRTFVGIVRSLLFIMLSWLYCSSKEQASFNFMAAITICSDFGAPQNKVYHCFHCFPIYFQWNDGTRCHDLSFLNVEF